MKMLSNITTFLALNQEIVTFIWCVRVLWSRVSRLLRILHQDRAVRQMHEHNT